MLPYSQRYHFSASSTTYRNPLIIVLSDRFPNSVCLPVAFLWWYILKIFSAKIRKKSHSRFFFPENHLFPLWYRVMHSAQSRTPPHYLRHLWWSCYHTICICHILILLFTLLPLVSQLLLLTFKLLQKVNLHSRQLILRALLELLIFPISLGFR